MHSWQPANATEAALLATIHEDSSCDVYADWLEERGDGDRAELLRIHRALRSLPANDARTRWLGDRLQILARHVDPGWRARVLPVERSEPEPEPEPVPVAAPPPAEVRARRRNVWAATVPSAIVPSVEVPMWIRIASALAGTVLVLGVILYALGL